MQLKKKTNRETRKREKGRGLRLFAVRKVLGVRGWLWERVYGEYERLLEKEIRGQGKPLPEHVAVIMDGNRRYARKIGISTEEGYLYGAGITERVIEWCFEVGVKQLTIYAFSIENFSRSDEEKERLFALMRTEFEKISRDERVHKNGVQVRAIGNPSLLPDSVRAAIKTAEDATKQYEKFRLFIALAYSGRMEIVDSVRIIANLVKRGVLSAEGVNEETVSRHLYISEIQNGSSTSAQPAQPAQPVQPVQPAQQEGAKAAVDLIIRTGGEQRLSNFVPWQALGNECAAYFCAPFWPEFRKIDLLRAVRTYQEREEEKRERTASRTLKLIKTFS
ncbi:MAG: polyprenyl diphosphate synthase [Methanophagales archaeon]|nr:polyprenyl diphosphate synthase [Methanophagales archaeon]